MKPSNPQYVAALTGTLYNGDLPQRTTSAKIEDGKVTLNFDHYLTRIVASAHDGQLSGLVEGSFEADRSITSYPLTASRHVDSAAPAPADVPTVAGIWEIEHESPKSEKA